MEKRAPYRHNVKYYETDKMGIVHHSNYIRWMEEARIDLMARLGCSYPEMEGRGIVSPVLEAACRYHSMTRFGEDVAIDAAVAAYDGLRLTLVYEIRDADTGVLRAAGRSSHCFLNPAGRPSALKKIAPDFDTVFRREAEAYREDA